MAFASNTGRADVVPKGSLFPDPALEAVVREAINKPDGEIVQADLVGAGFTQLFAGGRGIQDLSGLENCTDLTYLELQSNNIVNIAPLASLTGLVYLDLNSVGEQQEITDLGPVSGLAALTTLRLNGNGATDLAPLSGLTQLEVLYLDDNPLTDLGPLAPLVALNTLSINSVGVDDLTPIAGMEEMAVLFANYNAISQLSPLASMAQLVFADLTGNEISDLAPLSGLDQLWFLGISSNVISDLSPLAGLSLLRELPLQNNLITNAAPLAGLTGLLQLQLHQNPIQDIAPLASLTQLNFLTLSDTLVQDLSPLSTLTALTTLELERDALTDLVPLSALVNLEHLSLYENSISDVGPLSAMTRLKTLSLDYNQILELEGLSGLGQIETLGIRNNSISDLAPLAGLVTLKALDLTANPVSDLGPLQGLLALESLSISGNPISSIEPLRDLSHLSFLHAGQIQISDLSPLAGLLELNYMELFRNNIFNIQPLVANPGIGAGDVINLGGNPLGARAVCTDIPVLIARGVGVGVDLECGEVGPGRPVITTDGGNGPGADFSTNNVPLELQGTCDFYAIEIRVNGSAAGVTHIAHETTWSFSSTLVEGLNTFSVLAVDDSGAESAADTLSVTLDATRPQVVSATALGADLVQLAFNEDMAFNAALQAPASYTFSGSGVQLLATQAVRTDARTVQITVNDMTNGGHYVVTASTSGLTDLLGNTLDPAANSAAFTGVNPNDGDSDNDGLPDSWEAAHDLDANVPSADDDPDADGLTNIEEFGVGSDPNDDADPPSVVHVSTTGVDTLPGGTPGNPWRTIDFAMRQVRPFATEAHPVTIQLVAGEYPEIISFAPHVRLLGANAGDRETTRITPPADALSGVAVRAAEDTAMRDLTIELPLSAPAATVLVLIDDVRMTVENCVLNGRDVSGAVAFSVLGPGSSDSLVTDCAIQRVDNGLRAVETRINITNNEFSDIRFDAIFVRQPEDKGAADATPLLGDFEQIEDTGINAFNNVEGFFVRNLSPAETKAEVNNWGFDTEAEIQAKMSGDVDFVPFLKGSVLAASLFVTVRDLDSGEPIGNATVSIAPEDLPPLGAGEGGLYSFTPITGGIYTVTVTAAGYEAEEIQAEVIAGDAAAIQVELTPISVGEGEGETPTTQEAADQLEAAFAAADTDSNGSISLAEAQLFVAGLRVEQFNQLDANADSQVTLVELQSFGGGGEGEGEGEGGFQCPLFENKLNPAKLISDWFVLGLSMSVLLLMRRRR